MLSYYHEHQLFKIFNLFCPEFSTLSYIRQYSNELELFFALREDLVFCSYSGIERTIANYDTEIDAETRRPRNQFGYGYGLGLDYTIAKNTALFIRHDGSNLKIQALS